MAERLLKLRYPAECELCSRALVPGDQGWWNYERHVATCLGCHPVELAFSPVSRLSPNPSGMVAAPALPATSEAGRSAQVEFEKRHRKREAQIDAKWGRLSGMVKFVSDDPQSTKSWATGSAGERRLAAYLCKALEDQAILLHDRRIPRSRANIDHLVVATSGVWIVDAKAYRGKVEQRDVGGWLSTDVRLYVNGRDRSTLTGGLIKQVVAVLTALDGLGEEVDVKAALCFVRSEWALFAKSFDQAGVLVASPKMLAKAISGPGTISRAQMSVIARKLEAALPPAS